MKKDYLFLTILLAGGCYRPVLASEIALSGALQPSTLQFVDTTDTAQGMRANGNLLNLGAHWVSGRFYTGFVLYNANFSYAKSPLRPGALASSAKGLTIGYGGLDAVIGYAPFERVSLFLDVKNNTYTWRDDGYRVTLTGLGGGIQAHYPLGGGWTAAGSIGVVRLRAAAEKQNIGKGGGYGFDMGVLHAIGTQSLLNISFKGYVDTIQFGDTLTQAHAIAGLQLGYQFHF